MGWLLDEGTYLDEVGGVRCVSEAPQGTQVWAGFELVGQLLADCHGEALCWDAKPIRWAPVQDATSYTVRVLHAAYPAEPEAALEGLCAWRDWLCSYGAAPGGSLGSSGISLVKATLEKELWTAVGDVPPVRFVLGGRQEWGAASEGRMTEYRGPLAHLDMRAAYARTLGEIRYGGSWHRVDPRRYPWHLDQHGKLLFARARVRIPEMPLGPLPVRPRSERHTFLSLVQPVEYPVGKTLQGIWTWEEIQEAEASGCRVLRLLDLWVHGSDERPFEPWWEAVQQGRDLPRFGGALAKATGNATWGMFAVRSKGKRQILRRVRVEGEAVREFSVPLPVGGNPSLRAPDLAESITGRVRAELHAGMRLVGARLLLAHTDGLWAFDGPGVPGWRVKLRGYGMRFANPQTFAWLPERSGEWEYVCAGIPSWRAEEHFERLWADEQDRVGPRPWALGGPVAGHGIPVVAA